MAKKTLKQNVQFLQSRILPFASLKTTFGPLQGANITHSMLMPMVFQVWSEVHWESRNEVGFEGLAEYISEIKDGNLSILRVTCYTTVPFLPKVY